MCPLWNDGGYGEPEDGIRPLLHTIQEASGDRVLRQWVSAYNIVTIYPPHIIYMHLLPRLSLLLTWSNSYAPFRCNLHHYVLLREAALFKNTEFMIDEFHAKGHSDCSLNYNSSQFKSRVNKDLSLAEQKTPAFSRA